MNYYPNAKKAEGTMGMQCPECHSKSVSDSSSFKVYENGMLQWNILLGRNLRV